jgi:putative RecB family exonuclease
MATYSHSRISTYESCPYQYKLKYIDKIKIDVPNTIEAFMGGLVHETLEKLYKDKTVERTIPKDLLLKFYEDLWSKEYTDDILIAKASQGLNEQTYKEKGRKMVGDYYDKFEPFDQLTIIGLETTDKMTLPDGNEWHVRIDKLGKDGEGNYYVCDYKTNARMKSQAEADEDRQLALYSVWVNNKFSDVKSVKLVWHMLAFNEDAISERNYEQLEILQHQVCSKIKAIENAKEFPTRVTGLCSYCIFKELCPRFSNPEQIQKKMDELNGVKDTRLSNF